MKCPLCHEQALSFYYREKERTFYQCANCELVHVPKEQHLSRTAEKTIYDFHQNDPNDKGYREFLSRLDSFMKESMLGDIRFWASLRVIRGGRGKPK